MAQKTKNNFQIPLYTEKADIPGIVRDNVENAEEILKDIKGSLTDLTSQMSSFETTLGTMTSLLGTLSDELDDANGVTSNEADSEAEE